MLKDAGCRFVILGHSERRAEHGETDAVVRAQGEAARRAGLALILCIGETLRRARSAATTLDVVARQLAGSLPRRHRRRPTLAIAYEPIWAIGTRRTPTLAQVDEVHAHIRARPAPPRSRPERRRTCASFTAARSSPTTRRP